MMLSKVLEPIDAHSHFCIPYPLLSYFILRFKPVKTTVFR